LLLLSMRSSWSRVAFAFCSINSSSFGFIVITSNNSKQQKHNYYYIQRIYYFSINLI
jgi:hypothetical protein